MKVLLLLLLTAAHAAPGDDGSAGPPPAAPDPMPLAIPPDAAGGPSPAAAPPPARAPAAVPPSLTPEKLRALRDYKARRLDVREEVEVVGGGYSMVGGWGYPYGRWGWVQPTVVVPEPAQLRRQWAVYRGQERLSAPRFLDVAGQPALREALDAEVRTQKRRSAAWFTVGGVGLASIVGGMVFLDLATTREQAIWANRLVLGGSAVGAGGLLVGSFPRARAERLVRYPSASMDFDAARQMADQHNEALRGELGLTPAEAWSLENPQP